VREIVDGAIHGITRNRVHSRVSWLLSRHKRAIKAAFSVGYGLQFGSRSSPEDQFRQAVSGGQRGGGCHARYAQAGSKFASAIFSARRIIPQNCGDVVDRRTIWGRLFSLSGFCRSSSYRVVLRHSHYLGIMPVDREGIFAIGMQKGHGARAEPSR